MGKANNWRLYIRIIHTAMNNFWARPNRWFTWFITPKVCTGYLSFWNWREILQTFLKCDLNQRTMRPLLFVSHIHFVHPAALSLLQMLIIIITIITWIKESIIIYSFHQQKYYKCKWRQNAKQWLIFNRIVENRRQWLRQRWLWRLLVLRMQHSVGGGIITKSCSAYFGDVVSQSFVRCDLIFLIPLSRSPSHSHAEFWMLFGSVVAFLSLLKLQFLLLHPLDF